MSYADLKDMQEERADLRSRARALLRKGDLTDQERSEMNHIDRELDRLNEDILAFQERSGVNRLGQDGNELVTSNGQPASERQVRYGVPFGPDQRVSSLGGGVDEEQDRAIRNFFLTGNYDHIAKRAQSESVSTEGGFLVPDNFSRQVLDLVRNETRAVQAGVQSMVFNEGSAAMWTEVSSGSTPAWRGEGETISESSVTFKAHRVDFKNLAVLVKISRELLADSPMPVQSIIGQVIAEDFGVSLDTAILSGSGGLQPVGISNWPADVTSTNVGGVPDWTTLQAAYLRLRSDNHTPNAMILNDTDENTFVNIREENQGGTDYVGGWLETPDNIDDLWEARLTTQAVSAGTAYIADWTQAVVAFRERFSTQVLTEAFASTGQIGIIFHMRADVHLNRPKAFEILTGMTTS